MMSDIPEVHSTVDRSLLILHAASVHSASTQEPTDQPGEMMLHNEVLGQQTLSYQCKMLVPKAAIHWSKY